MRKSLERALWAAIILGAIWLMLAEAAAYGATPPPRHAFPAKGNRAELRNQMLRPHLRVILP